MNSAELFVALKVPDNTAITALNTLHNLGFRELKILRRYNYYKFLFNGDIKNFKDTIVKVDLLINPNKHTYIFKDKKKFKDIGNLKISSILVMDIEKDNGILDILNKRLGFKNIRDMEKGVFWEMLFGVKTNEEANNKALKIAKELLSNEQYQRYFLAV